MAQQRRQFSEAVKRRGGPAPLGLGRYQQVDAAPAPANGVARPVPSENVRTALAAVPDPMDPRQRIQATVNTATDLLETERARCRISEAAYRVGRAIQATYEGLRASGKLNDRVDVSRDPEDLMCIALTNADRRVALDRHLRRLVGEIGARFLRAIICEGVTFEQYAAARGRSGDRAVRYVADRFRSMLEELAESWAARGRM